MNRLLILVLFISACGMQHTGLRDGGGDEHVLVVDGNTDDSQADVRMVIDDGGDVDSEAAVDPDVIVTDSGADAGQETGSDSGSDTGTDAGQDVGTDTAPDVTPTCDFGYEYCNGDCHRVMTDSTMCGTSCSSQVCAPNDGCSYNLQGHTLCCAPVLVIPGGTMVGHCPEGSCPTGRCYATVTGFSDITWFCCPPS